MVIDGKKYIVENRWAGLSSMWTTERLEKHFDDYRKWLERDVRIRQRRPWTIQFSLWVVNGGSAPAEDLDIEINFGHEVEVVWNSDDVPTGRRRHSEPPPFVIVARLSKRAAVGYGSA